MKTDYNIKNEYNIHYHNIYDKESILWTFKHRNDIYTITYNKNQESSFYSLILHKTIKYTFTKHNKICLINNKFIDDKLKRLEKEVEEISPILVTISNLQKTESKKRRYKSLGIEYLTHYKFYQIAKIEKLTSDQLLNKLIDIYYNTKKIKCDKYE